MMIGLKVDQQMATITSENPFCAPKLYRVDQYTNNLILYCSTVLIQAKAQMSYFRYRYQQKPKHNGIFAVNLVLVIEPIEQWFAEWAAAGRIVQQDWALRGAGPRCGNAREKSAQI